MFNILGGEPLINQELPEIVEYAAKSQKTGTIRITTNGTIIPSGRLIDAVKKYNDRVYFSISNYSKNEKLKKIIKQDEIIEVLKYNGIKYQVNPDFMWNLEEPLKHKNYDNEQLKQLFRICHYKHCVELLDGKIHICGKQSMTYELHERSNIEIPDGDYVDLRKSKNLREELINFYHREYFNICGYCRRIDKQILPAEQL
jgi:organic radical activating enzyme